MRLAAIPTAAAFLLDVALPPSCAGCGVDGEALCHSCGHALRERTELPAGVPIGLPASMPLPLTQLEWCAPFSGPVRAALHKLKYGGERRLAEPLGEAMAARWRAAAAGGDVLVPVPVHHERARQRGYDQAVLLARAASLQLGMPCLIALERTRATRPQFDLGRKARKGNVAGAFAARAAPSSGSVAGAWVVLVDDVVTTGSTLAECAGALYDAGAMAVSGLTVARER